MGELLEYKYRRSYLSLPMVKIEKKCITATLRLNNLPKLLKHRRAMNIAALKYPPAWIAFLQLL
jgi:hypothetical protein